MARTYETIYDTENAFDWSLITNVYIDGVLTIEDKLLDTGFSELTFYRDGYVSSFQVRDSAENVYNWDSKSTAYDATGAIIGEYIRYDNGRYVQMNITDGVVTSTIIQFPDTGVANALTQLSTIYGDGEVVRVFGSYANGVRYQDEFTDGIRDTRYWSDGSFGEIGVNAWSSITIKYDIATNQMTDRTTYFDNGIKRSEAFDNGVATTRLDEDRDDVQDWDTIVFHYDAAGNLASKQTHNDDGSSQETTYVNGIRSEDVRSDSPDAGGSYVWDGIVTRYDATGVITARDIFYDDGGIQHTTYVNGVRSEEVRSDSPDAGGSYVWDGIVTRYDATGVITARDVFYDDGGMQQTTYVNGVRSEEVRSDSPDAGGSYVWDGIVTRYDAEGVITERDMFYDDGTVQQTFYVDGIRDTDVRSDVDDGTGGIYAWDAILTGYDDAGRVSVQAIFYDNADLTAYLFDEGVRQTRLEYDKDNSDDWYLRVTDYGAAGNTVTTYATINDVPPEYSDQVFV